MNNVEKLESLELKILECEDKIKEIRKMMNKKINNQKAKIKKLKDEHNTLSTKIIMNTINEKNLDVMQITEELKRRETINNKNDDVFGGDL